MKITKAIRITSCSAVISLVAGGVWAANLLQNPNFDGSTADWTASTDSNVIATYATDDASGSPTSGSVSVTNLYPSTGIELSGYHQCVPVIEGTSYRIGSTVNVPSGQGATGNAGVTVYWMANPGCTSYIAGTSVDTDLTGVWSPTYAFRSAPAGSQSARVFLKVYKVEGGGSLEAYVDDVVFEPVLFHDDFESEDLIAWSSAVR